MLRIAFGCDLSGMFDEQIRTTVWITDIMPKTESKNVHF